MSKENWIKEREQLIQAYLEAGLTEFEAEKQADEELK